MTARDDLEQFLRANWTATPLFMLDDYTSLSDLPATNEQPVIAIDVPPATETLISIAVTDKNGYRTSGTFQLILLHPIGKDASASRAITEDFRNLLRARRIGATVLGAVEPFSALGQYDGKWQVYVALADYYVDTCN